MKKVTIEALKGSIRKWEQIRDEEEADFGYENCPLCTRFWPDDIEREQDCTHSTGERCPVYERTGKYGCQGSPYAKWEVETNKEMGAWADTPVRKLATQAEVDFLKSLLPE